jgi:hypothetical protein
MVIPVCAPVIVPIVLLAFAVTALATGLILPVWVLSIAHELIPYVTLGRPT